MKDVILSGAYNRGSYTLTASIDDSDSTNITVFSYSLQKCAEYMEKVLKEKQDVNT